MSRELGEQLEVAKAILKALSGGVMRRTPLEKHVCKSAGVSYSSFSWMFTWLLCDGDIEKCSCDHTAAFRLTRKGEAGLVWRSMV